MLKYLVCMSVHPGHLLHVRYFSILYVICIIGENSWVYSKMPMARTIKTSKVKLIRRTGLLLCIYAYMYNVHHMPPSIYIYIYIYIYTYIYIYIYIYTYIYIYIYTYVYIHIYIYVLTTHMYFDLHFSAPQQANIWAWHKSLGFCRASSRKLKTVNPDWIMQCTRRGM